MRRIVKGAIFFLLMTSSDLFAAKKSVSLGNVHGKINSQRNLISQIRKDITHLEKSLGESNSKYLKVVNKKKELEGKIFQINNDLSEKQRLLETEIKKSRRVLSGLLVTRLAGNGTVSGLLGQKVLARELSNGIHSMEVKLSNIKIEKENLQLLETRLVEYGKVESNLGQLLSELEYQKRDKANLYLNEVKKKDELQASYDRLRSKRIQQIRKKGMNPLGLSFDSPMDEYTGMEFDKKGVTFKYKGRKPVMSTASGKIIYQGTLSNFGNVIMIDHGKETRSIILGKFVPKISKGAIVRTGDILGYTRNSRNQEEKLYFEVRQKNKVQNTILLLNRKSLAKNEVKTDNT